MTLATTRPLRIVVCDDRRLFRESLSRYLGEQPGVGPVDQVSDGDDAVRAVRGGADILVLDVQHTGATSAFEVLEALANLGNPVPVLLLGVPDSVSDIVRAVTSGPVGICRGDVRPRTLFDAILRVVSGDIVLPDDVIAPVLRQVSAERQQQEENARILGRLTERETTVLRLLSQGLRRADIAERLGLSPNTVRTHLAHVMQKLGAHTQLEAAVRARELFRVDPSSLVPHPRGVHSSG